MDFKKAQRFIIKKLSAELPEGLYYHGLHHTLDVLDAAIRLAKLEKLTREETILLKTAALFHDAGFIKKYFLNEEVGAKIAKESLPQFGYSKEQIKRVCELIMATRLEAEPKNHLEKIMRDADLDYLGREDFYSIAETLQKELFDQGFKYSEEQWQSILIGFLEKHIYYTNSAKQMREINKQNYLTQVKRNKIIKYTPKV